MGILSLFLIWVLPISLLTFGLLGNTIGFCVFSRRSLLKFPGRDIYRALAVMDTLYLIHVVLQYLLYYNGLGVRLLSSISCKLIRYMNYSVAPISAWLIVYLSIHKYISIRFREPCKRWQSIIITFIITYNLIYYLPIMWFVGLITQRADKLLKSKSSEMNTENDDLDDNLNVFLNFSLSTNSSNEVFNSSSESFNTSSKQITTNKTIKYECNFSVLTQENIYSWMDLINLTILPFSLMIIFSSLLIHTIFQSRLRIQDRDSRLRTKDRNRLKKDIKFALTCILFNCIFIVLNLPICVANLFFEFFYSYYDVFLSIYYFSYCINFYILFLFNSIFRKQFLGIFSESSLKRRGTQ